MRERQCAECGHRGSERARFCERCGSALTPSAAPLRAPGALETRILQQRAGIEGERKQVTVMYTDIVGSMALTHALAAERWGFVLERFLAIAAAAVHEFEGTVNQFTGDGLLAVFGAPLAHEDHARRACLAVLELQGRVAELADDVRQRDGADFAVRCGLNSGEVVVGAIGDDVHMDFVPIGNTTALGKRIESLAPAGSIAISGSTAALVQGEFVLRELGEFEIKGAEGRHRVLELIGPGPAQTRLAAQAATRGLTRFVGRDAERAQLDAARQQALSGHGRAVGIAGEAGIGKSRLVHEFVADCAAHGIAVSSTVGVAHGRYVPFLPMLALCRDHFDITGLDTPSAARERIEARMLVPDPHTADLALLFEFLGIPDPQRAVQPSDPLDPEARQGRLYELVVRALIARGGDEPAVLVVEDLQWLDAASATLFEALVAAAAGTRTLVVGTHRPEHDAIWARTSPHVQIDLDPLDAAATDALLAELLGPGSDLAGAVQARSAGNPFFIEEIVQTLSEDGHLARAHAEQPAAVALPPTIQAGLAARIDRLAERDKALVQTMSVIGTEIPGALLSEVCGLGEAQLAEAVDGLTSAQMVIALAGGEYVFKHPLTREVAYESQLSETRARAHHTVAGAIARVYPKGLDERAALLAHHCEAAGDKLAAGGWHARAAVWAQNASPAVGMGHWRRVRHLADELPPSSARDELATKARLGLLSLGWRLGHCPEETTKIHAETRQDVEHFTADLYFAGSLIHSAREQEGLERFRGVTSAAFAAGDPGRALTAATGVAYASWLAGSLREGRETIDRALPLAADDPLTGSGVAFVCPLAHAHQSRGICAGYMGDLDLAHEDFDRTFELSHVHGDPETAAAGRANLALLLACTEQHEAALMHAALGREILEPTGNVIHLVACDVPNAMAHAGVGRFDAALLGAESTLATIREHKIGLYFEPVLLAIVARCKLALGEPAAALDAAERAVAITDDRGLATCALPAPMALAQVLLAAHGAAAAERIATVLQRAAAVARASQARVFEPLIERELGALAGVR